MEIWWGGDVRKEALENGPRDDDEVPRDNKRLLVTVRKTDLSISNPWQ